jgi:hypothetical protein
MLKSILVVTAALSIMFSTSVFSKDKVNGKQSEIYKSVSEKENTDKNKDIKKSEPKAVKYIWKDMPSYDKYGNEITPRMRENMRQNAELEKTKLQNRSEISETLTEGKEVK